MLITCKKTHFAYHHLKHFANVHQKLIQKSQTISILLGTDLLLV